MRVDFVQDKKGMVWDLLLYVPTVTALFSIAAKLWYGDENNFAYLLVFLGSFFFLAGANRILKTRLMILPTAPIAIEVEKKTVRLSLRNGKGIELAKDLRFYSDYAGRSFGLTGLSDTGQRLQYVFHKGQFPSEENYRAMQDRLRACVA